MLIREALPLFIIDMNKNLKKRNNYISYLLLAPWLVMFIIFMLIPFVLGIFYSFYDYNFVDLKFIGFENYSEIFNDTVFLKSIGNTVIIAFVVVCLTITVSLFLSYLIVKQSKKMQTTSKIALYVPSVSSSVAIVTAWRWIFGPAMGISSSICLKLGVTAIDWFGQPLSALSMVCSLVLIFSLGQPVVLYTAAMNDVPKEYYESASLDGASPLKQFFKITLPLIRPTTLYILVTSTIALIQVFEVPMLLTSGGPQYSTTTILLLLYKMAFEYGKFGKAAAMGVVMFAMVAIISLFQFRLMGRKNEK